MAAAATRNTMTVHRCPVGGGQVVSGGQLSEGIGGGCTYYAGLPHHEVEAATHPVDLSGWLRLLFIW